MVIFWHKPILINIMKLKKNVKIFLVILLICIFVFVYAFNRYKEYKYHQTNEYKLTLSGYTVKEAKFIEKKLSEENTLKFINKKKNDFLLDLLNEKYFLEKNLDRYLTYHEDNEDISISDVIAIVNVNADSDWYETMVDTDMSKGYGILVNKFHTIKEYAPDDLENISLSYAYANQMIRKEVNDAYLDMAGQAKLEGITLIVSSSYRSYNEQEEVYKEFYYSHGETYADAYAARAGNSEHQTGLALDIFSPGGTTTETFEATDAYKWLLNNSYKYGFILRYPKDKTYITGYEYESWHFRYLGKELATKVYNEGITYDEYYAFYMDN